MFKKINLLLVAALAVVGVVSMKTNSVDTGSKSKDSTQEPSLKSHFVTNPDGSYGGSIDELKYGKGAPLNGEYDILDSEYFMSNDYYTMPSTSTRILFPEFAGKK